MLYYLALHLVPHLSVFNVFTYLTVRAGAAALTAFAISLAIGPTVIRLLHSLKIGQYIRKAHVADLHELHKNKAGTPTMGGVLILLSTLTALLLWARMSNRLVLLAALVLLVLGGVGFFDDYLKLRRKQNEGLSAKAKFAGQIFAGFMLGAVLYCYPIALSRGHFIAEDIRDWRGMRDVADMLSVKASAEGAALLASAPLTDPGDPEQQRRLLHAINKILAKTDLASGIAAEIPPAEKELAQLLARGPSQLDERDRQRLNRMLLERQFPASFWPSTTQVHTRVEVPGLKWVLIPLGALYIPFVIFIIVGASNAVNLTDGLDGLAAGASIVSLTAYTAIAYIVSRADWATYLFLIHVPEASELTVFGAALLGAGLGFLWFNSHPAEVFMGDTGSLALGGAIGTMAVLTKQELLLILVGGLFVIEALSVMIQVGWYKFRHVRVFRMAPLHHHFELLGWSETKVTIRFWIIALVLALMSLATLKLR